MTTECRKVRIASNQKFMPRTYGHRRDYIHAIAAERRSRLCDERCCSARPPSPKVQIASNWKFAPRMAIVGIIIMRLLLRVVLEYETNENPNQTMES